MPSTDKRRTVYGVVVLAAAIWCSMGVGPARIYAQKPAAVNSAAAASEPDLSTIDAQRGALDRFLDAHPEIQSEVIGNPVVMSDSHYLHEHPELQAFLENHPKVKADPRAFVSTRGWPYVVHRSELENVMSYIVPATVFICVLLAVVWVVRAAMENRRWNRSFKMHEELHAKLIEKFASGQDFSTYLQTEAGRRLLEWTPPALDTVGGPAPCHQPNPLVTPGRSGPVPGGCGIARAAWLHGTRCRSSPAGVWNLGRDAGRRIHSLRPDFVRADQTPGINRRAWAGK